MLSCYVAMLHLFWRLVINHLHYYNLNTLLLLHVVYSITPRVCACAAGNKVISHGVHGYVLASYSSVKEELRAT